jgi:hypothetical protein
MHQNEKKRASYYKNSKEIFQLKSDEYVRFLTEQFVRYMETPRAERKKVRMEQKAARPPFRNQLFGQIPDAIESYASRITERLHKHKK